MNGEQKMTPQDQQPVDGQHEAEEVPAERESHEPDCWRYSRCWCGAEEDSFEFGRGER